MIVRTSFGRVALQQFPAEPEVWDAHLSDLLDLGAQFTQALFDRVQGKDPDISSIDPALILRLVRASTTMSVPERLGTGDALLLVNALYQVNGLEQLGKLAARTVQMQKAQSLS